MDEKLHRKIIFNLLLDKNTGKNVILNNVNNLIDRIYILFNDDLEIVNDIILSIHSDTLNYKDKLIPELDYNISIINELFGVVYLVGYSKFITSLCRVINNLLEINSENSRIMRSILNSLDDIQE